MSFISSLYFLIIIYDLKKNFLQNMVSIYMEIKKEMGLLGDSIVSSIFNFMSVFDRV